ncbi:MFS transporter [Paraliobacillus zengyii]|uniref:MFS transporter n=1 Tax=Paraliobacillus zengyii TaxID=2213194 RepID=UPI000DD4502A|nr:MFS transporter [Paraliobacillus zengyii]
MTKQTYILAFLIFILSTGGYTAMPLFPLLTNIHNITLTQASTLTATYIFTQKITPVLLGPLGDYYGYKRISILGELIRGFGFIGVGCVSNYISLLIFSSLAGLGGGFSGPSLQSLLMKSSKHTDRAKVSSIRASATNAGLLLGPIIAGIVILNGNYNFIFISAGSVYLFGAFLLIAFVVNPKKVYNSNRLSLQHFKEAFYNKGFLQLMIFMLMFYILFAQLFVTMPEYAKTYTDQIQLLFLINGITGLALQYFVGLLISKYAKPKLFINVGVSLIILAFVILTLWHTFTMLLVSIILFTIGEIFLLPIMEMSIANFSDKSGNMGLYFGISKLSDGIGRSFGSIMGGWLLYSFQPALVWLTFTILSILILLYFQIIFSKVFQYK